MHRFSWRMATVQMRLMFQRINWEEWMCVSSWTLYTTKHHPADLFTKAVWSHLLSSHDASALFLYMSVLMCVLHLHFICHRAATSVCVYTVCLLRKKVVLRNVLMQIEHLPRCPRSSCRLCVTLQLHVLLPLTSNCSSAHLTVLHQAF